MTKCMTALAGLAVLCFALATVGVIPASSTELAVSQAQLKTYTWSGFGQVRIKRSGQVIPIRGSGSVQAPSYQVGSHLAYNAFRYGWVERARVSLSDEVLTCTVEVTGPLP